LFTLVLSEALNAFNKSEWEQPAKSLHCFSAAKESDVSVFHYGRDIALPGRFRLPFSIILPSSVFNSSQLPCLFCAVTVVMVVAELRFNSFNLGNVFFYFFNQIFSSESKKQQISTFYIQVLSHIETWLKYGRSDFDLHFVCIKLIMNKSCLYFRQSSSDNVTLLNPKA